MLSQPHPCIKLAQKKKLFVGVNSASNCFVHDHVLHFHVPFSHDHVRKLLVNLHNTQAGIGPIRISSFSEQHVDTPKFALASQGLWLRKRVDEWTLRKVTASTGIDDGSALQILEITETKNVAEICDAIRATPGLSEIHPGSLGTVCSRVIAQYDVTRLELEDHRFFHFDAVRLQSGQHFMITTIALAPHLSAELIAKLVFETSYSCSKLYGALILENSEFFALVPEFISSLCPPSKFLQSDGAPTWFQDPSEADRVIPDASENCVFRLMGCPEPQGTSDNVLACPSHTYEVPSHGAQPSKQIASSVTDVAMSQDVAVVVVVAESLSGAAMQIKQSQATEERWLVQLPGGNTATLCQHPQYASDEKEALVSMCAFCGLTDAFSVACVDSHDLQMSYIDPVDLIIDSIFAAYGDDDGDDDGDGETEGEQTTDRLQQTVLGLIDEDFRAGATQLFEDYAFLCERELLRAWITIEGVSWSTARDGDLPMIHAVQLEAGTERSIKRDGKSPLQACTLDQGSKAHCAKQSIQSIRELTGVDDDTQLLYHGTSHESAVVIIEHGINILANDHNFNRYDFGVGFYMARDLETAVRFSDPREPAVLVFKDMPDPLPNGLQRKQLNDDEWVTAITGAYVPKKRSIPPKFFEDLHFVEGPICANARCVQRGHAPNKMLTENDAPACQVVLINNDKHPRTVVERQLIGVVCWPRQASRTLGTFLL